MKTPSAMSAMLENIIQALAWLNKNSTDGLLSVRVVMALLLLRQHILRMSIDKLVVARGVMR